MFAARNAFLTRSAGGGFGQDFLLWLDAANYVDGTTWPAQVGTSPTKVGTVTKTTHGGFPAAQFAASSYFQVTGFTAPSHLSMFAVMTEAQGKALLVEQSTNSAANPGFYSWGEATNPYNVRREGATNGRLAYITSGDWFPHSSLAIGSFNFNGSMLLKRNNTEISTSVGVGVPAEYATSSNVTDTLFIGTRAGTGLFFEGGFLLELIIANGMSTTNYQIVLDYLRTKYSL